MSFNGNISLQNIQMQDPVLNNLIQGYKPQGLIADQIMLRVPVDISFGRIPKFGGQHLTLNNTVIVSPGRVPSINFSVTSTDTYTVKDHGLQMFASNLDAQQFGGEARLREIINYQLADSVMIAREYGIASQLTSNSVITQYSTPSFLWSDYTNSDPVADFKLARDTVYTGCGLAPNVAIMGWQVYNALIANKQLINAAFGYAFDPNGFTGQLNEASLARVMGVEKIIVGKAQYNTAKEGQTMTLSPIWGKHCVFAYINPVLNPNMAQQSLGYSFTPSNSTVGFEMYNFQYIPLDGASWKGQWLVHGRMYDDVILNAKAAYLFESVVA